MEKLREKEMGLAQRLVMIVVCTTMLGVTKTSMGREHDYGEALSKSILFFEGQRSGKLPPTQRMTWRKDSALQDGSQLADTRFFDKVTNLPFICIYINSTLILLIYIYYGYLHHLHYFEHLESSGALS